MISGAELVAEHLSAPLRVYFDKKLASVAERERWIRIEEMLKFIVLMPHQRGPIPVIGEIDDVWHWFILQTEQYAEFCDKLGHGFIQHSSNDYPNPDAPTPTLEDELQWLVSYVANYGPFDVERARYWRVAACLMSVQGWNIDELNDFVADLLVDEAA